MNTITLDLQGETKQLHENVEFKEKFERKEDNIIINKNSQKPFSGILTINYNSGKTFAVYNFVDGKQKGKQKNYYKNGKISSELNLINRKYDGEYKQYYESGKIKSLGIFDNGKQTFLTSYFEEGGKNSEFFLNINGIKEKERTYFKTGGIHSIKEYNHKSSIKATYHYENGKIESTGQEMKKGGLLGLFVKEGTWRYYYENGNIKEEGNWGMGGRHGKDNIKKGVWKYYNEEGKLESTKEYDKNMGRIIKEKKYGN
ncbi:MAG: hypothetical protein L3J23_00385 [Flavobacteriaceae bacterium]|nr:hypothetical protein [Flavobacteriaceae bacterium]